MCEKLPSFWSSYLEPLPDLTGLSEDAETLADLQNSKGVLFSQLGVSVEESFTLSVVFFNSENKILYFLREVSLHFMDISSSFTSHTQRPRLGSLHLYVIKFPLTDCISVL